MQITSHGKFLHLKNEIKLFTDALVEGLFVLFKGKIWLEIVKRLFLLMLNTEIELESKKKERLLDQ